MRYKPYEFKVQDAYDFAHHIGIPVFEKGNQLHFKSCPYCRGRGRQNENSFAIDLKEGVFKCLRDSCGVKGNMVTLSKDFDFSLGNEIDEYYKPRKEFKKVVQPKAPIVPKPSAITYLESRGISKETAGRYEITTQTEHDNVLVFPFFDDKGILQFIKYRKTDYNKETDSAKEWCEANCKPILFGMKQCEDFTTLVVTEGQMDSLSVAEAGIKNAVSVPTGSKGFTWIPYCWDWLNKFHEIVIFGDHEKGHITLLDEFSKRLKVNIKHIREEDYKDCKDANEILLKYGKEQIKVCIENAVPLPMNKIIDLSTVEDVNIFDTKKLKTGITSLDKLLYGGIPFGGLVLISGKAGEGKSTFASQIMVNAIEQGETCFAYSGELPNHLFKAWLDYQIAGERHIFEYTTKWGEVGYSISQTNKALINNWYKGKFFLYDNNDLDGDEKESLLKVVEKVIVRHGVNVILLDNLMTAIDLEPTRGDDKYDRQSQFVKKMARLAMRYNVLILLVAHKRKNNTSTNENDEIMGSSDIGNLATLTIAYEKANDIPETQRLCKVSKNRLFGKTNTDGWTLMYSVKSKRVYEKQEELGREYSWNHGNVAEEEFMSFEEDADNPFE